MSSVPPPPPLPPFQPYQPPRVPPSGYAPADVSGPATGLIITAITGGILQLFAILINMLGIGLGSIGAAEPKDQILNWLSGGFGVVSSVIGLVVAGLILYGATEMRNLRQWGLAVTASVVAMVPCMSPCCILGLPFGIWSLVVLTKEEVKAAFR